MRWLSAAILLLTLSIAHVVALERSTEESNSYSREDVHAFVMPSKIIKIASLEFDGLVSDYIFLKGIILLGSAAERSESLRLQESEWRWIYNIFDTATNLDPYFYDPYYFANAYLPTYAGMTEETNSLLEKGSRYRGWDWVLPFFIGFNHFYYFHDDNKAAEYFMKASHRQGANPSLANIAAKLMYQGKRTENAIFFLEEMIKITNDESIKNQYKVRLQVYIGVLFLEQAVAEYTAKFKKSPKDLEDLVRKGVIQTLPVEPYGGKFYLDAQRRVKTTSGVIMLPEKK